MTTVSGSVRFCTPSVASAAVTATWAARNAGSNVMLRKPGPAISKVPETLIRTRLGDHSDDGLRHLTGVPAEGLRQWQGAIGLRICPVRRADDGIDLVDARRPATCAKAGARTWAATTRGSAIDRPLCRMTCAGSQTVHVRVVRWARSWAVLRRRHRRLRIPVHVSRAVHPEKLYRNDPAPRPVDQRLPDPRPGPVDSASAPRAGGCAPRPRSSGDRASASGAVCAGSNPAEGAQRFPMPPTGVRINA